MGRLQECIQRVERLGRLVQVTSKTGSRPQLARRATATQGTDDHSSRGTAANAERIHGKRRTYTIHRPVVAIGGLSLRHDLTMRRFHLRRLQSTLLWIPITTISGRDPCTPKSTLIRPVPYRRIGEASHPGPTIRMPGDGHCIYHALGWWADKPQAQVRSRIAEVQEHTWKALFPWDNGDALRNFKAETLNPHCWGGADQIAVAAALWKVRVTVRTSFGDQVYGNGANWYLQYQEGEAAHYDVWTPSSVGSPPQENKGKGLETHPTSTECKPQATKRKQPGTYLGGARDHEIYSLNLNGSREALQAAFGLSAAVLMLQEHRLAAADLAGIQAAASQAGWHGVWDPCTNTLLRGRSGGTAILTRKPRLYLPRA